MKKNICEKCGINFERHYVRRFCSKSCWHKFNANNLASFNDKRFKWEKATDEEKIERMKNRFESKVVKNEGCWGWNGYLDKNGYPIINSTKNLFYTSRANRISWILHYGSIPKNKYICHKCDNPICTNPDHLFLGTHQENLKDMQKKKRGNLGEKHGNSKLTDDIVREIRNMYNQGLKISIIMEKFNICRMHVHDIGKRKIWKHI